jgi:hypothetical protein
VIAYILLVSSAFAAHPKPPPPPPAELAHYVPADVAAGAHTFVDALAMLDRTYGDKRIAADLTVEALDSYERALQVVGDRITQADIERYVTLRQQNSHVAFEFSRSFPTRHGAIDAAFGAAVMRAVKAESAKYAGIHECNGPPETLWNQARTTRPASGCEGVDISAALAADADADAALQSEMSGVLLLNWNAGELPAEPQPINTPRWISLDALMDAAAHDALAALIDREKAAEAEMHAEARDQASVLAGELFGTTDVQAKLDAIRNPNDKIKAKSVADRAAIAKPILDAVDATLAAWQRHGEPATGLCLNPPQLGGCVGEDATAELVPRLLKEKKVADSLPKP